MGGESGASETSDGVVRDPKVYKRRQVFRGHQRKGSIEHSATFP